MSIHSLVKFSLALIVIGFMIMFLGTLWMVSKSISGEQATTSVGGVLIIGPIPIVFGYGPHSLNIIIALLLIVIALIVFLMVLSRRYMGEV